MENKKSQEIRLSCGFTDLKINALVGVYEHEIDKEQEILVSLSLFYSPVQIRDLRHDDSITNAFDYAQAADLVKKCVQSKHHGLLEHLSLRILDALREAYPHCTSLSLEIKKMEALEGAVGSYTQIDFHA